MISLNLSPSLNPGLLHKTRTRQNSTRLASLLSTGDKPFINCRYPLGFSPIRDSKPLLSLTNPSGFSRRSRSISAVGSSDPDPDIDSGEPENKENKKAKNLQLGIVFGLWYFQNIVFNIFNKKALNVFPYPWLLASFQLFAGSIWMLILWSFKLYPCPKISKPFIIALLGPALFHTVGHISACVSFSKVAVSFTHVIKSAEPVFSVIFSSFLGDSYPLAVWLSILPIVMGCSLAAVTEVSFNLGGLSGAMISNVGFVLRNIYSKRSLQSFKEIDGLNLYGCISILALVYLFPVAIFVEGSHWVQGYHKAIASVGKPSTFYVWVLLSGVFYHLYNQSSYQALDEISPLTFSVGNTMKRVVVIVSTVLVFRNPVRPLNALGSAIAIFGTFLYSQATAKKKKIDAGSDKKI
ncbi:unnamed protein product [Arabis nemorensis]|uniref:Sugar phosphate transporter domain-containing protein n=1 Tax=Arabis nemorensis TaxID=586526 RepID=A0A565CMK7_9BRAS|nr:unnamed protein product [Arabis nemorensis]